MTCSSLFRSVVTLPCPGMSRATWKNSDGSSCGDIESSDRKVFRICADADGPTSAIIRSYSAVTPMSPPEAADRRSKLGGGRPSLPTFARFGRGVGVCSAFVIVAAAEGSSAARLFFSEEG